MVAACAVRRLGLQAHYTSLLPGSCCSARAPLMNVPLTNAVKAATRPSAAGVASALLNAPRESRACSASR